MWMHAGLRCQVCAQSGTITPEALQSVPGSTEEQAAPRWGECTSGKSEAFISFIRRELEVFSLMTLYLRV